MFNAGSLSALLTGLLVIAVIPDVSSYSKYGRSCKDIGCRSDEVCVMAEDPCTDYSNKCGRYPTCKKMNDRVPYPIPPPTPPPRAYGPGRSSGRSGSRNTIGDNSIWNRLFGDDRNRGSNGRSSDRSNSHRTRDDYYNTHASTDNRGNRVWTFSG